MRSRSRWLVPALLAAATLLSSTSALAASYYYGELLTTDKFSLLPNRHATATLGSDFKNFSVDSNWALDPVGSGLGSGKVPPAKTYAHSFSAPEGAQIEKAWLVVSFSDDGFDSAKETAVLDVTGSLYQTKGVLGYLLPPPMVEVLTADVTAKVVSGGGKLGVTISPPAGTDQDFYVHASLLKVQYSLPGTTRPPGGTAVPEPGAFLVFAVGLAVTAAGLRSRTIAQAA